MRSERAKLSRHNEVGKAMDYVLKRISAFTQLLADGRICLSNNAGERAAVMFTLIQTAKLNGVDPQAWLADTLARIADHNSPRLDQLLPWNWKALLRLAA
jgi:transposase